MRNFLLILFVVVCSAVVGLDHYTLKQWQNYHKSAENQFVQALTGVCKVAHRLDRFHNQQEAVNKLQCDYADLLEEKTALICEYSGYLKQLTDVIRAQQEEAVRLNGIIDDLSQKLHEEAGRFGEIRVEFIKLYQYAQLAQEYINAANKVLRAHNLPLPKVQYDGARLFDEDAEPIQAEDKNT